MPVYVLDSNFFIQAHRFHYPIDVAAGFWNKVRQLAEEAELSALTRLKRTYDKNDALEEWCRNNLPEAFFKDTSVVMTVYAQVTAWAMSRSGHYLPNALNEFLDAGEADAFLVAYCLADTANRFVVTQEVSEPNRQNKVKIPDACIALNVSYVNTIEMFRQLGERF
ncbi:MAG: DUF4411 family protein [Haliscomenobacter sp.]|nr:DUF4411 family protein [Haliscomenobacter sp.]